MKKSIKYFRHIIFFIAGIVSILDVIVFESLNAFIVFLLCGIIYALAIKDYEKLMENTRITHKKEKEQ
jgi:hypothetical protein